MTITSEKVLSEIDAYLLRMHELGRDPSQISITRAQYETMSRVQGKPFTEYRGYKVTHN